MTSLIHCPRWFCGFDVLIDVFSLIVLLMIGYFSLKNYKLSGNNKNHLWIGGSFFTLALGFLLKVLTNFTLYYKVLVTKQIGLLTLTYEKFVPSNILVFIGFNGYKILTLIGLYMLFMLYQKEKSMPDTIITTYLLFASIYFVQETYLFNITCALLLILITYEHHSNCKKQKTCSTVNMLTTSFGILALSHVLQVFLMYGTSLYVIAEAVQLVGYSLLLYTFIKVLQNAKKAR